MARERSAAESSADEAERVESPAPRGDFAAGAGRWLAAAFVVLAGALLLFDATDSPQARWRLFDLYQRVAPRDAESLHAAVVAVDEEAIARYGAWPWPRSRLAELLETLSAARPGAIGMDMLFAQPDVNDPRRAMAAADAAIRGALRRGVDPLFEGGTPQPLLDAVMASLATTPSTDDDFEFALFAAPVVLARRAALASELAVSAEQRVDDGQTVEPAPIKVEGPDPGERVAAWAGVLRNLSRFEAQARGIGFITAASADRDGVIRRVPLIARVGGRLVPTLPVEMLRVAQSTDTEPVSVVVETDASGVQAVRVGAFRVRTDRAGRLRLHLSGAGAPDLPFRSGPVQTLELSAATVLGAEGSRRFDPAELRDRLLLLGVTDVGGVDVVSTPVNPSAPGVSLHAETLENIIRGHGLERPGWMVGVEIGLLAAVMLAVGAVAPRLRTLQAGALLVLALTIPLALSFGAYLLGAVLLAPLMPMVGAVASLLLVRGALFARTRRRARALAEALEAEKLESARVAGELGAAREIQLGLLPDPKRIAGLPDGIDVAATLTPAREVGGDLYDLFMLDEHRFFFVVGDVAGKGIPASLFMALGKTLCKSNALRDHDDLGQLVTRANAEIARDNPAQMFITALFGVLDTRSGALTLCNAGHDDPLVVAPDGTVRIIACAGGPPLCMLDDFSYAAEAAELGQGEAFVSVTDGVGEAQNAAGELFGREGLERALSALAGKASSAVVTGLTEAVERHADGADPYDDLTALVVRRQG